MDAGVNPGPDDPTGETRDDGSGVTRPHVRPFVAPARPPARASGTIYGRAIVPESTSPGDGAPAGRVPMPPAVSVPPPTLDGEAPTPNGFAPSGGVGGIYISSSVAPPADALSTGDTAVAAHMPSAGGVAEAPAARRPAAPTAGFTAPDVSPAGVAAVPDVPIAGVPATPDVPMAGGAVAPDVSTTGAAPVPHVLLTGVVQPAPPGARSGVPSAPPGTVSGEADGRAPATRTTVPARRAPWEHLTAEGESLAYVEGRPGQELAENLAELRRRELPTRKDVERDLDQKRRVMPLWQELPLLAVVSFCVAVLVRSFLVQAFVIPSGSMEDTLLIGDRVLVNKIVYETRDPRRGEVVVFRGTELWAAENVDEEPGGLFDRIGDTLGDLVGVSRPGEKDFIKRVIGVPGDRVECCDARGRVTVNGVGIDEPYLSSNSVDSPAMTGSCGARRFAEVVVPPGELFLMGDNRALSQDSRCQGTVPIDNVVGHAFLRVWPPSRWGGIGSPGFAGVPPAAAAPALSSPVVADPADPTVLALALLAAAPLAWLSGRGRVVAGGGRHVRCVGGRAGRSCGQGRDD
jgi:signal peptidase I